MLGGSSIFPILSQCSRLEMENKEYAVTEEKKKNPRKTKPQAWSHMTLSISSSFFFSNHLQAIKTTEQTSRT